MKTKHLLSLGIVLATSIFAATSSLAKQVVDVYSLQIALKVPQVVDNTQSLGKRVYKLQKITGRLLVYYDGETEAAEAIELVDLVNLSYKVGGKNVKYKALEDGYVGVPQIWNAIGSNKTLVFNKSSVCFNAELEPSYSLGEPNNDNSLILVFSGASTLATKKLSCGVKIKFLTTVGGYVVGTQGCGCHDYGHVSPTRSLGLYGPTDQVVDIAAVWGTWKAKFQYRTEK